MELSATLRTAAHVDRCGRRRIAQHDADAGSHSLVLGIADQDAVDVGDQVAGAGTGHGGAFFYDAFLDMCHPSLSEG